jgi:hypothetical protein
LSLICLGVSLTKMAEVVSEALILPLSPCSAGKKRDSMSAGLHCPSRGATSRVIRKYGSCSGGGGRSGGEAAHSGLSMGALHTRR